MLYNRNQMDTCIYLRVLCSTELPRAGHVFTSRATACLFELGSPCLGSTSPASPSPGLFRLFPWEGLFLRDTSASFSCDKCSLSFGRFLNVSRHLQHFKSSFRRGSCRFFRNAETYFQAINKCHADTPRSKLERESGARVVYLPLE